MLPAARLADNRGFTLIEVMVAILIMTIGMLALLQTVNLAIVHNTSNKLRNDGIVFADEAVGVARARAFSAVFDNVTTIRHKSNLGFVNYSIVTTVSNLTAVSKNVRVIASWRDKSVRTNHSLSTIIVDNAN